MWFLIPNTSTKEQTSSGIERVYCLSWFAWVKGNIVNVREGMLAYFMDDVIVLRETCCAFRNLFFKFVKYNNFREVIIKFSICNKVFRTCF